MYYIHIMHLYIYIYMCVCVCVLSVTEHSFPGQLFLSTEYPEGGWKHLFEHHFGSEGGRHRLRSRLEQAQAQKEAGPEANGFGVHMWRRY